MRFEEWVRLYEKKTKDKHCCPDGFTTLYDSDKGYAQYMATDERLYIYEACGDGNYWYNLGVKICRDNNIPAIVTVCTRKILPYLRGLKFKIIKQQTQAERRNGLKIEGVNHLGLKFYAFPAWWDEEKKTNAYYVVTEVIEIEKNNEVEFTAIQEK